MHAIVRFCMYSMCSPEAVYAQLVLKPGFFLGILDLAMLSFNWQAELNIVFWDQSEPKRMRTVKNIFSEWVPYHDFDWGAEEELQWHMIACRADLEPVLQIYEANHWVPAFTPEGLGPAAWEVLRLQSVNDVSSEMLEAGKLVSSLAQQSKPGSGDEALSELEAQHESAVRTLVLLERKLEFLNGCHDMRLHPILVPADGDCGIWSALTLIDGRPEPRITRQDVGTLRADTWTGLTWSNME